VTHGGAQKMKHRKPATSIIAFMIALAVLTGCKSDLSTEDKTKVRAILKAQKAEIKALQPDILFFAEKGFVRGTSYAPPSATEFADIALRDFEANYKPLNFGTPDGQIDITRPSPNTGMESLFSPRETTRSGIEQDKRNYNAALARAAPFQELVHQRKLALYNRHKEGFAAVLSIVLGKDIQPNDGTDRYEVSKQLKGRGDWSKLVLEETRIGLYRDTGCPPTEANYADVDDAIKALDLCASNILSYTDMLSKAVK